MRQLVQCGSKLKSIYDVLIIGAGHNGLIAAAYLSKAGQDNICVLEQRPVIGGAAVTEEIVTGFKFSRCSYLLSLLRPQIIKELNLEKRGLRLHFRNLNSFTPIKSGSDGTKRSLKLYANCGASMREISKFSEKDANAFEEYEKWLTNLATSITPLIDSLPPQFDGSLNLKTAKSFLPLLRTGNLLRDKIPEFYQLITAPMSKVLDSWFESEPLKATLATDSVIGAMVSPHTPGSGYVLLHHVMGETNGVKGAWAYPHGGMGSVSEAIADCAVEHGTDIFVNQKVEKLLVSDDGKSVEGVQLTDGNKIKVKKAILSNATPRVTFEHLLSSGTLPEKFERKIRAVDYTSPVTKINVALKSLPKLKDNEDTDYQQGTIHLNCENIQTLHSAYNDCQSGKASKKPMIEMTIPSSLDDSLAPAGCHVALLFTQYTPFHMTDQEKEVYTIDVLNSVEEYFPGFQDSIVGKEVLTPKDLESIFSLTGGNIFHGSMSLDQLFMSRPIPGHTGCQTPLKNLYLCGSALHPGGGVMGTPGKLAAQTVWQDIAR